MNAKDFEKYSGKKTKDGGIVVGYDESGEWLSLLSKLSKLSEGYKDPGCIDDVTFATEKYKEEYESGKYTYMWVDVNDVIMDGTGIIMDEPLDLTKILEGCEGVELWSNVLGKCKLSKIYIGTPYPIVVSIEDKYESFTKNGLYNNRYETGKCLLYPSESNRDWSTFKKPVEVKDGDWVVCCDKNETGAVLQYGCITMDWKYIIPFDKFVPGMAEEEMKKLSII